MTLLEVRNLTAEFVTPEGAALRAIEDVSFSLDYGEALGLVGESGCGKTTTMLAMLRLLPAAGRIVSGEVLFEGSPDEIVDDPEVRRVYLGDRFT